MGVQGSEDGSRLHGKGEKKVESTGLFLSPFININRNLSGDKFSENQRQTQPRMNNVFCKQISFSNSASGLKDFWINAIGAFQTIDVKEELYTDYRPEYSYS